ATRSPKTRHATTGSENPLSSNGSRRSHTNTSPSSRRVLAAMSVVLGAATLSKRAARLRVSPTTICSCADSSPMASPTTTPTAAPDDHHAGCQSNPHLQRLPGRKQELTDLRHEIEPNPHGAFSIVLVRLGIAKVDKESVAHESCDMPAHLSDPRGATTLESA